MTPLKKGTPQLISGVSDSGDELLLPVPDFSFPGVRLGRSDVPHGG
jgi:hypothetical protein